MVSSDSKEIWWHLIGRYHLEEFSSDRSIFDLGTMDGLSKLIVVDFFFNFDRTRSFLLWAGLGFRGAESIDRIESIRSIGEGATGVSLFWCDRNSPFFFQIVPQFLVLLLKKILPFTEYYWFFIWFLPFQSKFAVFFFWSVFISDFIHWTWFYRVSRTFFLLEKKEKKSGLVFADSNIFLIYFYEYAIEILRRWWRRLLFDGDTIFERRIVFFFLWWTFVLIFIFLFSRGGQQKKTAAENGETKQKQKRNDPVTTTSG